MGFSPTGRGGAATVVGADIAEGGKEGRTQWRSGQRVEISRGLHNLTGRASLSLSQSRRIYHASPRLTPDLSHSPEYQIPNILSTHLSHILTIPCSLSFRPDTSPTFGVHHLRIIFGDLIRVVGELSDAAVQGTRPAAELVSHHQSITLPSHPRFRWHYCYCF